jgi:Zn-dependent protease with chaperone function
MKVSPRVLACVVFVALLVQPISSSLVSAKPKEIKIRGYITALNSPTSFEVEDYRITRDESVQLEFENATADTLFRPEDLRIGTLIELKGLYDEDTGELKARSLKVDLKQFRTFNITTVLDRRPTELEKVEGDKWRGLVLADGRRIRVEPVTQVFFKLNKTEKKESEQQAKALKKQATLKAKEERKTESTAQVAENENQTSPQTEKSDSRAQDYDDKGNTGSPPKPDDEEETSAAEQALGAGPLTSLADIGPGVIMTYQGKEQPDGSVLTSKVTFVRNEQEKGEKSLWRQLKIKEKPSNFESGKPGELKVGGEKYKVLPNQEVQEYVNRIGQSLIPDYQRNLPVDDPNRIPFRFIVIVKKGFNAGAYPNGVVIIHDDVFKILENEAQLAAVLGHEIAHATQEHSYRQLEHNKKRRKALLIASLFAAGMGYYGISNILDLVNAAMITGYSRTMENQADRVGLQYLTDAGYDPREAPRVWKLTAKKYGDMPTNFFWSTHDSNSERRSFQMLTIRNTFGNLDFAQLTKGDDTEFKRIAELAYKANPKNKKTIKVTS